MWIAVHEMGMQNTRMRPVHLRDYAMWLEADFGVNAVWTSGVEDTIKERRRSPRLAKRRSTHAQQHDHEARLPTFCSKRIAIGSKWRIIVGGGGIEQHGHLIVLVASRQLDHLLIALAEI